MEGSCGLALELIRSPKFFQADGGLRRVVWMPKEIKERYKDVIPADLYDKIATEKDVKMWRNWRPSWRGWGIRG